MTDIEGYKSTKELLDRFSQGHLLAFYQQLDGPQKQHLLEQINRLDFSHITDWIENFVKNPAPFALPAHFDPAPAWLATPTSVNWDPICDIAPYPIRDGKVDLLDFAVLAQYWLENTTP